MKLSEKLKAARNRLALTLETVSERTGIAASALSDFENAHREPKLVQLQKLAVVYHQSVRFLLDETEAPPECVLWRERPTSPNAAELQARFLDLAKKYQRLEVLCAEQPPHELLRESGTTDGYSSGKAEALAYQVRTELGLGERPGQTLLRVLEEVCNVKVFHLEFEPTRNAACSVSEEFGTAILLNSGNTRWQRNFDLAQELFHLLTWQIFRCTPESFVVAPLQEEKYATSFARHLLMPIEAFKKAVHLQQVGNGKLGFDGLFEVAREFDVSLEAVLWHMRFVFHLDDEKVRETIRRLKVSSDTRESDPPPRYPTRYVALCNQAFRKGLISTGRYAEYLGISRQQAMKHFEQEAMEDVEVELAHS